MPWRRRKEPGRAALGALFSLDGLRFDDCRRRLACRADAPDLHRAVTLDVMGAQRIEVEAIPDPRNHRLGDDDLAPEVLGEPLDARRDVHRVADRRVVVPYRRSATR